MTSATHDSSDEYRRRTAVITVSARDDEPTQALPAWPATVAATHLTAAAAELAGDTAAGRAGAAPAVADLARSVELLLAELDRFESLLADLLEISRYDAGAAHLEAETSDIRGFRGAGEKSLQANADTEERPAGCNMCLDCWEVTGCCETGKAVTEVADAISMGKLDNVIAEVKFKDEIGTLAKAIARLSNSVRLAMDRLSKR